MSPGAPSYIILAMSQDSTFSPPPSASPEHAEKYISWLTDLINRDQLEVYHSDLTKFSLDSMQNHYRVTLQDYEVEVSHNKQTSGEDLYVILFNNLKNVATNACERTILSFAHLTKAQFDKFKQSADNQISRKERAEQEKKFKEVMAPLDSLLESLSQQAGSTPSQVSSPEATPVDSSQNQASTQSFMDFSQPTNSFQPIPTPDSTKPSLTPNLVKPPLPDGYTPEEFAQTDSTSAQSESAPADTASNLVQSIPTQPDPTQAAPVQTDSSSGPHPFMPQPPTTAVADPATTPLAPNI